MITKLSTRAALLALVPLALLGLAACGDDDESSVDAAGDAAACDDIETVGAFVRLPPGDNTAIYLELTNDGDTDTALVGAEAAIAEEFELHEMVEVDGVMEMTPIEGQRIELPAGETVVLEPGGLHVMALGVTQELAEGDMVDVVLEFEGGCTVTVAAEVRAGEDGDMEHGDDMGDMSDDGSDDMGAMDG